MRINVRDNVRDAVTPANDLFLLPGYLRGVCYLGVVWTFYSIFASVGLSSVYRKHRLGDIESEPPFHFWMFSKADEVGVLSDFRLPQDQLWGLFVASLICLALIGMIRVRRSRFAVVIILAGGLLIPLAIMTVLVASTITFERTATLDKLIPNDMAEMPKVFWIGGALEYVGSTWVPLLIVLVSVLTPALRAVHRYFATAGEHSSTS